MTNNQLITIGGVETFSTVDFPNKISAAIFMQGCPWKCPFCYNYLLQTPIPENEFVWDKFVDFLKTRTKALDGVVFSGGEPLMQNGLKEAMLQVKELGFQIGLHTGGYRPEALKNVLDVVDWVGFDIKTPFEKEKYNSVTKANHFENVLTSLKALINNGVNFECRTTCDPRILTIDDIYKIANSLKEMGVKNYHLQKYRPIESDITTQEYECEQFFNNKDLITFLQSNFNCELRT